MEMHEDPEVRAKVLATVTFEEAQRTLRSRAGKPWCDAFTKMLIEGVAPELSGGTSDGTEFAWIRHPE